MELLTTGRITLPVPQPHRDYPLQAQPDCAWANSWKHRSCLGYWGELGNVDT